MSDQAQVAVEALTEGAVNKTATETPPGGTSARTVLLVAVWVGLIAGFVDAGLLVVNTRLIARGFYHEGSDFA
jgi:hypothetical protein